jgi:phosphatidate cytidylyltransferase
MIEPPHPTVLWTIAATFAALVVGTAARFLGLRKADPELRRKRFASLRTWWLLALVWSGAFLLGRLGACALLGFASILAFREYATLLGLRDKERPAVWMGYGLAVLNYLLILFDQAGAFLVFIPVAGLGLLALAQILQEKAQGYIRTTGSLFWALMVVVYGMSHAAFLFILPASTAGSAGAVGNLLFLLILTESNDIFQALVGRAVGAHKRHPIAPVLSPNKTWEGFLGGLLVTLVLSLALAPWLTGLAGHPGPLGLSEPLQRWLGPLAAGLLIAVAGYFGDINMSGLKRDSGVKDSSRMLPGMGGLIDRIDSLTFTAPTFVYFLVWWMR